MTPEPPTDADRLRRLQSLTDAALTNLELEALLAALLRRIREMLEVDTCAVLLLDEARGELVARAAVGLEEEVERGVRIPVGRGFAGRIAAERRPVTIADVRHVDVLNPILRELLGRRGGAAPARGRPRRPRDRPRPALQAERAARTRLERIQSVTDAALPHLELDELLDVLLPRIRTTLDADTCAVLLLDEEGKELVARAAVGLEEEVEQGIRIPYGRGFAGRVAAQRTPVVLDDVDHADVLNPILREKGVKSLLGVPLLALDAPIGVLHVGSLSPRLFTSDDVELLTHVAERVALAIQRARLHEETVLLDQLRLNFVAVASHELRTPAASVYGILATLVERGDALPAEARDELIRVGYEQGERLRVCSSSFSISHGWTPAGSRCVRSRSPWARCSRASWRRSSRRGRRFASTSSPSSAWSRTGSCSTASSRICS